MATPLLQTKLYIPAPRAELVPRPRLIERTVKKHLNNIFGKLHVSSRTQAVARARKLDLF